MRPPRLIASRPPPASTSAPSRRKKSRCRFWRRSRWSAEGDSAERGSCKSHSGRHCAEAAPTKIQFNGAGGSRAYIGLEATDSRDRQMSAQEKNRRGLAPVTVALFVAIAGQAVVLFNDFGPG